MSTTVTLPVIAKSEKIPFVCGAKVAFCKARSQWVNLPSSSSVAEASADTEVMADKMAGLETPECA